MKNIFYLLTASILGGFISFGLTHNYLKQQTIQVVENTSAPAHLTSANNALPKDFIDASSKATRSVVHIKAQESEVLAQQRLQDRRQRDNRNPRGFFDMEDFFGGDFFGSRFHQQKGSGSGVIVSSDGYIVTNNHVVGFADDILVTLDDGREFNAMRIGTDPSTDLAVIKIQASSLPAIEFANSDEVKVGEWVLAAGNPFDYLTSTVTAGIVSAIGRDINIIKGKKAIEEFIQTDAAVNPGNSGGALVNEAGQLIGINTAIATPTGVFAGYSFAIPSNLTSRILKEIIENGDIERASLGVYALDVEELIEKGEDVELDIDYGVYVDEVIRGTSADYAGMLPGDIIIGIDKNAIDSYESLVEALKFAKVGDTVKVKIVRNNAQQTIRVKLRKGI